MKNITFLLLVFLSGIQLATAQLVIMPTANHQETLDVFKNPSLTVHFYRDEFVVATAGDVLPKQNYTLLDSNPWGEDISYYLVYADNSADKQIWLNRLESTTQVLFDGGWFMIVSINEAIHGQLPPAKNDGLVRIFNQRAVLPEKSQFSFSKSFDPEPFVIELLSEIAGDTLTQWVQHLEDYGTRNAYSLQSVQAQQWIAQKFLSWGLDVEVMDFSMPGGPASDNVIATLVGTKYPDEFVVIGGHSDSYSTTAMAPGADDNASGTAGVMEIARILSQYEFDRSIVFCAFSGEEYGLYGSAAYASRSAQQGMDILGYLNMDMIGYLKPGNTTIMTSLIYPQSAKELADFYTEVAAVYLPDFVVTTATLIGGDSDHTSFNNNGYMGIFPFEDANNYSPYIHTANDIVGPSYNHQEQAVVFTKAILASAVTMANLLNPPRNLLAIPGNGKVNLQWDSMIEVDYFKVYRDGDFLNQTANNSFTDTEVENGVQYEYYVTAIHSENGEESGPSNRVTVTPMPPISFPLLIDFENGTPYWDLDEKWGLTTSSYHSPTYSLTESPQGNYQNNREDYATLHPVNLMGFSGANLSFYTHYDIENNYDFMYLQVSTDGINWDNLDTFTGTQSQWTGKSYSLNNYLNEPFVVIRFKFFSDFSVTKDGMYIDDFQITTEGGYESQTIEIPSGWSGISTYLDPAQGQMTDVLYPIFNQLEVIQDFTQIYWPEGSVNTFGAWNTKSGYKIKVNESTSLVIQGFLPENNTLELVEGWNLIPVLSQCPVNVADGFGSDNVELIKEIGGSLIYWPSQNISTLNQLLPGKAYLLKAHNNAQVTFPECNGNIKQDANNNNADIPWQVVKPTGNSHVILLPGSVLEQFDIGDFIGVFTIDGMCAGYIKIENTSANHAIVAFANDTISGATDGFEEFETMSFKLFSEADEREYDLIAGFNESFPHENVFVSEGISGIFSLELSTTGIPSKETIVRLFPNPAQNYLQIATGNHRDITLKVFSSAGQLLHKEVINGDKRVDLSSYTQGVYFFRMEGISFSEVHKVVIH